MSDIDDRKKVQTDDITADSPESRRKRLLKPVHEENFPDHVGEKNVCTIYHTPSCSGFYSAGAGNGYGHYLCCFAA